jgi:hypothetical protein
MAFTGQATASKEFKLVEEGDYDLIIAGLKEKISKSKKNMVEIRLQVCSDNSVSFFDNIVEGIDWKITQVLRSLGQDIQEGDPYKFEVGTNIRVGDTLKAHVVKVERDDRRNSDGSAIYKNEIGYYIDSVEENKDWEKSKAAAASAPAVKSNVPKDPFATS